MESTLTNLMDWNSKREVKEVWKRQINEGVFTVGEECAPRESDDQLDSMSRADAIEILKRFHEAVDDKVTAYLDPSIKPQCEAIIAQVMTKETKRACDYRHTAILLLMNLLKYDGQSPLCLIFRTIVEMSDIMYSSEDKRTTRSIFRFYNLTWLHAMTCTEVMYTPRNMTPEKFFGAYFHALSSHAAQQYEVVCLKSVNTENEERILGMASKIATTTSNRKPENVLPNILLRLQGVHSVTETPWKSKTTLYEQLQNSYHQLLTRLSPK
eukprot:Em0421g1a